MESLTYSPVMTEDVRFGQGAREVRLQDGRVVTMQEFDPGVEWAYRSGYLPDYVGKGRTTLVSRPTAVTQALTIPRNETLLVTDGGSLDLQANLTVYGRIVAGKTRIFSGPGTVSFPEGATVQAEWWGAVGDGVTDCAPAINAALNAHTSKIDVRLGEGTFLIGSTITTPTSTNLDWALRGCGMRKTMLQRSAGFTGALLTIGNTGLATNRYYIEHLGLSGVDKAVGTRGIRGIRAGQGTLCEVYVTQCEIGVWLSGGSYQLMENCYIELNTSGVILDNTGAVGFTFARIEATLFRANQTALFCDGTASATNLVRNISLYRCAFENDALASGTDIGVKIRQAEQVHVHECWFEDNSYHVNIDGGHATRAAQFLTFTGCNFGNHHASAAVPEAFLFNGSGPADGRGCVIQACRINEGAFQFNQTVRLAIRDTEAIGTATLTGNSWYQTLSTDTESEAYSELATKTVWRPWKMQKNDGVLQSRVLHLFCTGRTTNATETTLGELNTAVSSSVLVSARVQARKSDNSEMAAYHISALFTTSALNIVTQVGATTDEHAAIESAGAAAWAFDLTPLAVTGTTVRFRATGAAATTIDWAVWITTMQLSAP